MYQNENSVKLFVINNKMFCFTLAEMFLFGSIIIILLTLKITLNISFALYSNIMQLSKGTTRTF